MSIYDYCSSDVMAGDSDNLVLHLSEADPWKTPIPVEDTTVKDTSVEVRYTKFSYF